MSETGRPSRADPHTAGSDGQTVLFVAEGAIPVEPDAGIVPVEPVARRRQELPAQPAGHTRRPRRRMDARPRSQNVLARPLFEAQRSRQQPLGGAHERSGR
nr:hypothetical protein [Leifsonia xyli]